MSWAWQGAEKMAVNMPLTSERWNLLSKWSLILTGRFSCLEDCASLPPPIIHPGLGDAERHPSGPCNFGWSSESPGNFKKYLCSGLPLTNRHCLCRWGLGWSVLKLHRLLEWTTEFENHWPPALIFKFWFSSGPLRKTLALTTGSGDSEAPQCLQTTDLHRKNLFLSAPGCFSPPSPISCFCPGTRYHHISWLKCNNVNWSDDISNWPAIMKVFSAASRAPKNGHRLGQFCRITGYWCPLSSSDS